MFNEMPQQIGNNIQQLLNLLLPTIETQATRPRLEVSRVAQAQENFIENVLKYKQDNSYGSCSNPIIQLNDDIKYGYGWGNNELILETLIVQLASYCNLKPQRQVPLRVESTTEKVKSRRLDLLLRPSSGYWPRPLKQRFKKSSITEHENMFVYPCIITEIKCNYIDQEDVINACAAKQYPQLAFHRLSKNNENYQPDQPKVIFQMVAPAGITEEGVKALKQEQDKLRDEFDNSILLDAITLDFMVWEQIYPAIEEAYKDEQGKIGRQFGYVKSTINTICEQISNPNLWLDDYTKIMERFRKSTEKKKYLITK